MLVSIAFFGSASSASPAPHAPPSLITPRDVLDLPVSAPDHLLRYGPAESQFGELRLPTTAGPHPVVVLIHGGCWSKVAGASFMGAMADALKAKGIATWNIEYRRLPEEGSGWPGTYLDTAQAIDHLRVLAPRYNLELGRVVLVGHSAGGHLAHWAAGRHRLDPGSTLYVSNPLVPRGVINLAGRLDMAAGISDYERLCRGPVVQGLLGGLPFAVPERYRDASPQRLLPLGVKQVLIWGEHEEFVPVPLAQSFISEARRSGDDARLVVLSGVGHFDTASPVSDAWPAVENAIRELLGMRSR
jgi:acetyl esterase/lipase